MSYRPLIIAILAAAIPLAGCKKKLPTATKKPPGTEEPAKPEDSVDLIGMEAAGLVKIWVLALSVVETDESAATTAKGLTTIEEQFDYLVQRAERLPRLSPEEFKRIDDMVDSLLTEAASGLEVERKRIFLLPPSVKDQILPLHEQLLGKFRDMSRAISEVTRGPVAAPDSPTPGTSSNPLDAPARTSRFPPMKIAIALALLFTPGLVAAKDWPNWRGPNHDGISEETGLDLDWPKDGPKLLWQIEGCGRGYSSVVVADGKIITIGNKDGGEHLTAFSEKDG